MDLGSVDWETSVARSEARCKSPTGRARKLLDDLQESKYFWYALRRHGDSETCTNWLEKLRGVSSYDRNSKYEEQRREYIKLVDEVNRWQPGFRHEQRVTSSGSSNNRSDPYPTVQVSEMAWFQQMCANVWRRWWIDEQEKCSDSGVMQEQSEPQSDPHAIEGLALQLAP